VRVTNALVANADLVGLEATPTDSYSLPCAPPNAPERAKAGLRGRKARHPAVIRCRSWVLPTKPRRQCSETRFSWFQTTPGSSGDWLN
jgi:hypothetical protein